MTRRSPLQPITDQRFSSSVLWHFTGRSKSDAEFMKNAASYMTEFEQLLQRAAQGGDPVSETRAILISDRGKVYTMLAHASGRLG